MFECCGPLQSVSPWWQETEIGKCLGRRRDSGESPSASSASGTAASIVIEAILLVARLKLADPRSAQAQF